MRKKLFAILMSAMMMVTFMPSMAFADVTDLSSDDNRATPETYLSNPAAHDLDKGVEVVPGTCKGVKSVLKKTCEECGDYVLEEGTEPDHSFITKDMTQEEFDDFIETSTMGWMEEFVHGRMLEPDLLGNIEYLLGFTASDKANVKAVIGAIEKAIGAAEDASDDELMVAVGSLVQRYLVSLKAAIAEANDDAAEAAAEAITDEDYCYFHVTFCKNCQTLQGKVIGYKHTAPADLADCAESFVCTKCGETVVISDTDCSDDIDKIMAAAAGVWNGDELDHGQTPINWNNLTVLANMLYFNDSVGHDYEVTTETKACGTVYTVACTKCGVSKSFTVPTSLTKHKFEWKVVKAGDCSEDGATEEGRNGLEIQVCKECGAVNPASLRVFAPQHNYVEKTFAPTCTFPGYTVKVCTNCKTAYVPSTTDIVPALGHDYDIEYVLEPSCKGNGILKIACKNCKQVAYYGEEAITGTAVTTYDAVALDVSSLEDFKDNAEEFKEADLEDEAKWAGIVKIEDKLHAETDNAKTKYFFVGYDFELLNNPIELESLDGGHDFSEWAVAAPATCTHGTIWAPKCSDCDMIAFDNCYSGKDETDADEIVMDADQLEHTPKTVTVPAVCGEFGYTYKICTSCNQVYNYTKEDYLLDTDVIAYQDTLGNISQAKLEKALGEKTALDPEGEAVGIWADTVAHEYKSNYVTDIDAQYIGKDHVWDGPYKTMIEATIFDTGCEHHTCSVCGAVDTDEYTNGHLNHVVIAKKGYASPVVKAGSKKATVKVGTRKTAVSYKVQYRKYGTANASKWHTVKTVKKATKVTVKNLKSGQKYNFRIVATNAAGKKAYSKVTKGVKIK